MKDLNRHKKIILLIVGLILFFHTTLFADSIYSEESYIKSAYNSEPINTVTTTANSNHPNKVVEVSLNSFGSTSVMIMLVLTSMLGAFFVRNELSNI